MKVIYYIVSHGFRIEMQSCWYLHSILELRNDRAVGDEVEHLLPPGERQGHDQEHEYRHLAHEEEEHLWYALVAIQSSTAHGRSFEQSCPLALGKRCVGRTKV